MIIFITINLLVKYFTILSVFQRDWSFGMLFGGRGEAMQCIKCHDDLLLFKYPRAAQGESITFLAWIIMMMSLAFNCVGLAGKAV